MLSDQLSFDFRADSKSNLVYFALRPDWDAGRAIIQEARQCSNRYGLTGTIYDPGRLHVSLNAVMSPRGPRKGDVAAAVRAAEKVAMRPFAVSLNRLLTFRNNDRNPIVLGFGDGAADIADLRNALREESLKAGLWRGPVRFRPHVTLLRDRRTVPETRLDEPIRWTVTDFILVHSLVGRGRQIELGRWQLGR